MKEIIKITIAFLALFSIAACSAPNQDNLEYTYSVPSDAWEETMGAHRAVISVTTSGKSAEIVYNWRRHAQGVAEHRFVIVNAQTGDTVPNILRKKVDNEVCDIVFGPVEKGEYFFYYLPYVVQQQSGGCAGNYLPKEEAPDSIWAASLNDVPMADIMRVESRTQFDSFYPMELPATEAEVSDYLATQKVPLYVFPEDRAFPARMKDAIPARWLSVKQGDGFSGTASPNEYYAFQLCVWAPLEKVGKLQYSISSLSDGKNEISASAVTCFNTEGTNPYGESVTFDVSVEQGHVQPLWFGVDIPDNQASGTYKGILTLKDEGGKSASVPISIKVSGKSVKDRGDSEVWKHSRLRWLNSTLGIEDKPTSEYVPMKVSGDTAFCLGRNVVFNAETGSPLQINSWGNDILAEALHFVIIIDGKEQKLSCSKVSDKLTDGTYVSTYAMENDDFFLTCENRMEFDGWLDVNYTFKAKRNLKIDDIRLEIPVKKKIAYIFEGLGIQGRITPQTFLGGWDGPKKMVGAVSEESVIPTGEDLKWPFDSFWIGTGDAGIQCEFRGTSYSGPLLNVYHPAYPDSWYNTGRGGFRIGQNGEKVTVTAFSGERSLAKDTSIKYEYALIVTPVKKLTSKKMFTDRYYHSCAESIVKPTDEDIAAGVKVVNVHHSLRTNPYINYPYLEVDTLRRYISDLHAKGCKVKIYYTLRELSNACTEMWAIRSLGTEIMSGGNGGGFAWLQEHLVTDYTPMWYHHFTFGHNKGLAPADAAIMMAEGDSRWFNYYIEGLAWMVRETDIDGIYMDDVTFDRRTVKRLRRAMDSVKPGCLVDLHSNTNYSKSPSIQYTEFFPYIDKLWFGEFFHYDNMSAENYLIESSGIPFGLSADMLWDGGNPWLGMLFGMTCRYPYYAENPIHDPHFLWKAWDDFGIRESEMHGFWEEKPIVATSDRQVKATAFVRDGKTMVAVGNYSNEAKKVRLDIDWNRIGLDSSKAELKAPAIEHFQTSATWRKDAAIPVDPKKGWIILLEN